MSVREFLGIRPTHNPHRWTLPVRSDIATPGNFLFGGAALAAGITAMEATTGRPAIWATAQYLSFARLDSIIDLDVEVPVHGNNVTQARAIAHVNDREIITVNAALGERDKPEAGHWAIFPEDVPAPADSPLMENHGDWPHSIHDCVELRVARGKFGFHNFGEATGDGRSIFWARLPGAEICAATLAIFADFMPSGIGNVLGKRAGGNSLDNTIRIVECRPSEWVLGEIHVHGMKNGFAHGRVHLWSEDGHLLATASQSVIVRLHEELKA